MLHLSRAREPRAPPYPFVIIFLIDVNEKKNKTWALGYNGHCAWSHFHPIVFALLCGSFIDNESFVSHCNGQDHHDLSILILTIWRYTEEGWCGGGRRVWYLRGAGQPPPEPGVSQGRVGRHPGGGIPLQTPADEVQEQRVVAPLQRSLQLPGAGRPARLASPRPPAVQHCRPVRQRRRRAVPRVAWRGYNSIIFPFCKIIFSFTFWGYEIFCTLWLVQQFLWWHS